MREARTARSLGPALLALLIAGQAAAFVDRSLPAVMAPALKATLGLTDIQLGLLQGPAFVAFYVLAALGAGLLADHPARLRILAGCVLTWTAATLAFALAPDFRVLVAGRLVVGPAQAIFSPLALSLMAEVAPQASHGRRLALFTTSASVGRSLAFLAGGALLVLLARGGAGKADAWRLACVVMTAPNLLVVAGLAWARPAASDGRDTAPARLRLGEAVTWLAKRPAAGLVVFGGSAAAVLAVQTVSAWAASVLNRGFGLPAAEAALVFGLVWIPAAMAGHLGGGWMLDALAARRRPPIDLLAAALLACGASVAASAFAPSWPLCALAFAGAAAAGSTAALSGLVAMQTLAPDPLRGALGALFLAATSLVGFGVGPLVTGVLSDLGGTEPATLGTALATCVGPACAAGALLCLAGRRVFQRVAARPSGEVAAG